MTTELTPKWPPIPFPAACAPQGARLFDSQMVHALGLLVAGGPSAVTVFQILKLKRALFTVSAKVGISGFAAGLGELYVQDGPVISAWDINRGNCLGAMNLVNKKKWRPTTTPVTPAPPAEFYTVAAGTPVPTFSAPVVREHQEESQPVGEVFVLASDGTLHALDDTLNAEIQGKFSAPLRPELVLAEIPQPGGTFHCHLYWITSDGGIFGVDGMQNPLKATGSWATRGGTIDAAKVLPLHYEDGFLFGGGILGADFFATLPDPAQPFALTIPAPPGGWKQLDVMAEDKLLLVSTGTETRLASYDRAARLRDRWRIRPSPKQAYSLFWNDGGSSASLQAETASGTESLLAAAANAPTLTLEIDHVADAAPGMRVLVANTVDPENPASVPDFPPVPAPIVTGALTKGDAATLDATFVLACRPIISQQTLYCVAWNKGSTNPTIPVVVAYSLTSTLTAARPLAAKVLEDLRNMLKPVYVILTKLTIHVRPQFPKPAPPQPPDVYTGLIADTTIALLINGVQRNVTTNALGVAILDATVIGKRASVDTSTIRNWDKSVSSSDATLAADTVNNITVTLTNK